MAKYAIWDKKCNVYTPSGRMYTAEQWIEKHPIAELASAVVICSASEINGAFFGVLSQMKSVWEAHGADFSACTTDEEVLTAIESFENARSAATNESVSAEERIAAALEAQNLMAMADVTE